MNAEKVFNKLSPYAMDPKPGINYKIDVFNFDGVYGNYSFVKCQFSELCVKSIQENGQISHTLFNYKTGRTIALLDNAIDLDSSTVRSTHKVYCNDGVPIVVCAAKEGNDNIHIYYYDCYGNEIYSQTFLGDVTLKDVNWFDVDSEMCVEYKYETSNNTLSTYFKVENINKEGKGVQVIKTNWEQYNSLRDKSIFHYSLQAFYDKDGNIFAYRDSDYNLYNSKKEFVKKLDISEFPDFYGIGKNVRLEKKLLLFSEQPYRTKDSKLSYIEWDLITGETKYVRDIDLKYDLYNIKTINNYSPYKYTFVSFLDYSKSPSDNYSYRYTILTDEFKTDDLMDFDGFIGEVYKVNSNYIMAEYMDGWHLIGKTSNRKIDASEVILNGDNKVYLRKDSRDYCISIETLIDYFGSEKEGFTSEKLYQNDANVLYVSDEAYNGKRIIVENDSLVNQYNSNNILLNNNCVSYALAYGLLIDNYYIRDQSGNILIDYTSTGRINKINQLYNIGYTGMAFEVLLEKSDGSDAYRYFTYNRVRA